MLLSVALSCVAEPKTTYVGDNRAVMYELPDATHVKGLIVVLPGCNHRATDWWVHSDGCTSCIGLPIELFTVRKMLQRNFAVAVVTSQAACFSPATDMYYLQESIKSMKTIIEPSKAVGHHDLPVFLYGISGGGSFAGYVVLVALV